MARIFLTLDLKWECKVARWKSNWSWLCLHAQLQRWTSTYPRWRTGDTHANLNRLKANHSQPIRKSVGNEPVKRAMMTTLLVVGLPHVHDNGYLHVTSSLQNLLTHIEVTQLDRAGLITLRSSDRNRTSLPGLSVHCIDNSILPLIIKTTHSSPSPFDVNNLLPCTLLSCVAFEQMGYTWASLSLKLKKRAFSWFPDEPTKTKCSKAHTEG